MSTARRWCALVLLGLLATAGTRASAERLPLRAYGTADGLPSTDITRIVCDRRGFLWFASRDGLARFDGERFVVYGTEQGLPVATVNDMVEARDGGYWVATNGGGVCWLDPAAALSTPTGDARPLFRCRRPGSDELSAQVNLLLQDRSGRLWAGTDGGLFRRDGADGPFTRVDLGSPALRPGVVALAEDSGGALWIGSAQGLFRRSPDGGIGRGGLPGEEDIVDVLLRDRRGRIWVGFRHGLTVFIPGGPSQSFGEADGLPHGRLLRLLETTDGHVWAGTVAGLAEFDGGRWRTFTRAQGLAHDTVTGLAEDHDGNLWMATVSAVMKLVREGFVAYDEPEEVFALYEGAPGEVFTVSGAWVITRFEGERAVSVRPVPPAYDPGFAGQAAFRDHAGEWWLLSTAGLGRFPHVQRIEELQGRAAPHVYTPRDGVPGERPRRLFEDAHGDLWIGADGPAGVAGLARWDRAKDRIEALPQVQANPGDAPTAMNEDASGALWVGFIHGGVGRLRAGRFTLFPTGEGGAPKGRVSAIHRDDAGRLWIGTADDGLTMVEDPSSERPRFRRYTKADGLASNNVRCVVSDREGRIYAGTVHGVDRLDPSSGQVRRYTTVDGLPNARVTAALRDGLGRLWFGTRSGLARLTPAARGRLAPAPPVWIAAVRIGGTEEALPHVGAPMVRGLVVEPERNHVQIEFFSVGFAAGETLRFQHRLEDAGDWSQPSEERAVQFSALRPGRHLFLVRAVNADGRSSAEPASVEMVVEPTLGQRPSVRVGLLALAVAAFYGAHRLRLGRRLAVERLRTRIATDLHDDVGSSVSRMALLSEVVKRQVEGTHAEAARILEEMGASARELVDSTSDIVWAIDPRRDDVASLEARVREFGAGLLEARGIVWELAATPEAAAVRLEPEERRQLFLILKEALHNVGRHAGCARASVTLAVEGGRLRAEVQDDGRGFVVDDEERRQGHGLESMRARAARLGGSLEVRSAPGAGTRLTLTVPLRHR